MKTEKLNKYKLGNFKLTKKHIYAKNKLTMIFNKLLNKVKKEQYGGSINPNESNENTIKSFLDKYIDETFSTNINGPGNDPNNASYINELIAYINKYFENFTKKDEVINNEKIKKILDDLMNTDRELNRVFGQIYSLINNTHLLKNNKIILTHLIEIQKGLFKLQVGIIFHKLKKITQIDIEPVFNLINKKINVMNEYITNLNQEYDNPTTSDISGNPTTDISGNPTTSDKSGNQIKVEDTKSKTSKYDFINNIINNIYNDIDTNEDLFNTFINDAIEFLTAMNTEEDILPSVVNMETVSTYNNKTLDQITSENNDVKIFINFLKKKFINKFNNFLNFSDLHTFLETSFNELSTTVIINEDIFKNYQNEIKKFIDTKTNDKSSELYQKDTNTIIANYTDDKYKNSTSTIDNDTYNDILDKNKLLKNAIDNWNKNIEIYEIKSYYDLINNSYVTFDEYKQILDLSL